MRSMTTPFALCLALLACSSMDSNGPAPIDMSIGPDMSAPPDLAMARCSSPSQCAAGTPHCCTELALGAGNPPNCPLSVKDPTCQAKCDSVFPLGCPSSGKMRLCDKASECADDPNGYKHCCELAMGANKAVLCVSDFIKNLVAINCKN